jgi:hypothetical protein
MEKEGTDFGRACSILEKQHGLPPLPWEGDDDARPAECSVVEDVERPGMEEAVRSVHRVIDVLVGEKEVGLDQSLRLWEAYDRVVALASNGSLDEDAALRALARIQVSALHKVGG